MRIYFQNQLTFEIELTEDEMASGNVIGGLDFTVLVSAVGNVQTTLQSVADRLSAVATAAGSTDPAQSQQAQQEIQTLADQLNGAVSHLQQVQDAANQAAQGVAGQPPATGTGTPAPTPTPAPTTQPGGSAAPTGADVTSGSPGAVPATPANTPGSTGGV